MSVGQDLVGKTFTNNQYSVGAVANRSADPIVYTQQSTGAGFNGGDLTVTSVVTTGNTTTITASVHRLDGSGDTIVSGPLVANGTGDFIIYGTLQGQGLTVYAYISNDAAMQPGNGKRVNVPAESRGIEYEPICFATGTLIRTARGDVPVEKLQVGEMVVTACGELRPIAWIGHRVVDCTARATPSAVWPVRILAGAFGGGLPERDLYLSPGHPVLVGGDEDGAGGCLVPIMCLINGTTIDCVPMASVTYWHVELDAHDILLAEGLPAESYLDWGDRPFFEEADEHALANPDFVVPGLGGRCRPVAVDGEIVEAERRRLDCVFAMRLAEASSWPTCEAFAF